MSRPQGELPLTFRGIPRHVQTATFWLDDSGSRGSAGKGFVIGGLKTRHPDDLQRRLHSVRDRHGHAGELKFSAITERSVPRYLAAIEALESSDAHVLACVLEAEKWNPFRGSDHWVGQSMLIGDIVIRGLNRNEVCSVHMDGISTPEDVSLGRLVKRHINRQAGGGRVISAVSLNSKSNDLLQLADLVAGSVRYLRSDQTDSTSDSPKLRVALALCSAFRVPNLADRRSQRVRIHTLSEPPGLARRSRLKN